MKILVTGGAGFIGSHITEYLVQRGDDVTVLDNLTTGKKENLAKINDKINFVNGDIRDYKLLEKLVNDTTGVFHEAALASVQQSFNMKDEYFDVNVNGTENILKLSKEYGFKVVYASSSSVYGNPKKIPIKESDEKNPINPYAETKLQKEDLAIRYSEMGVKVIGLRYFNVFGKRQSKEYAGVLKLFLERISQELPPKINGDGTQFRDFVHVQDVVNANIMSMDNDIASGFFNVGTNTSTTILELAKNIIEYSGLDIEPIFKPTLKGDVHGTIANIDLIRKEIGWKPSIMLIDWMKDIISSKKFNEV
jgi:UDP-glucose 4-epimerase